MQIIGAEHARLAGLALALTLAWGTAAVPAQDQPAGKFEVCVVGTIHAPWQFRYRGISPAHVRAALVKSRPEVIGVESNPEWFAKGRYHEVTYEAQGIAVPFARSRKIPVYGIDWMDVAAFERREADRLRRRVVSIRRQSQAGPLPTRMFGEQSPAYLLPFSELRAFFGKQGMDFAHVNDIGSDTYGKQWLRGDPRDADFGGHRNRMIVKRCVEVMRQHPGKRLVVVIGAGHKAVLDVLFGQVAGVEVLRLGQQIAAPTAAEIAAAERPDDLVLILGHNIDGERSCFHQELIDVRRMRELIGRLRQVPGRVEHANYFAARLAYLTGDLAAAERWLDKIGEQEPKAVLYPFPLHHWRMVYSFDQVLRIARAEVALARERPAAAARHLQGLVMEIPVAELPGDLESRGELVRKVGADAADWSTNGPALKIIANARFLVPEQVRKPERGMAAIKTRLQLDSAEPLRIDLSVRARNRARGGIELYEWDPDAKRMNSLGRSPFVTGPRWDRVETRFQIRDPKQPVWVYVYLDAAPGTRFGVKDIEIRKDVQPAIPADWIPRTLAREYVRALLKR